MAFGLLEVQLINAKGLKGSDFLNKIDPYVVLQYKNQERQSQVARGAGEGGSPVWNEKLTFRAEYPGQGGEYKLILKIMDKDTFSADDYLGQATIYVKELLEMGVENGKAELHPHKYSVVQADQSYCGEIQVGIHFTLKAGDEVDVGEEIGGWTQGCF
ncbi:16 kDa phloem protein 1 isoform X2 [Euphorbia lathyris]|uniref:16 kDa phloem protein 1 isoform X2 n=1 Tax=Euphorbia lathyris TaxID=212925 RepID=UPI0033136AC7